MSSLYTPQKTLAWGTDFHLDHLSEQERQAFYATLAAQKPDGILMGGDLAVAHDVEAYLVEMQAAVSVPIYFVLGNHDYYYGSISDVRRRMCFLTLETPRLFWLPEAEVVRLTERTALVGHGGWGDGRLGNIQESSVRLNDFEHIDDLCRLEGEALWKKLRQLGREAANHLHDALLKAIRCSEYILVLMHVPPFPEACVHEGKLADDHYLPHFACGAAGDVLQEIARQNPYHQFTVLCGHTHGHAHSHRLPNLRTRTAPANYGEPRIADMIEVL